MSIADYPPPQHVLRDLGIETESSADGTARGWLLGHRPVTAGILATLVDVVAAGVALPLVQPDWMATADMALELVGSPGAGVVEAAARPVRRGRTTLVVEVDLTQHEAVGWATVTFSVLPRRETTPVIRSGPVDVPRSRLGGSGGDLGRPVADAAGLEVLEPGVVSMPVSDYVRNSFGAVQGGMMAMLGDVAAASAVGGRTVGLHVAYLALARVGPVRSRTEVLGGGSARVELVDSGADGRVTTVVQAAVRA